MAFRLLFLRRKRLLLILSILVICLFLYKFIKTRIINPKEAVNPYFQEDIQKKDIFPNIYFEKEGSIAQNTQQSSLLRKNANEERFSNNLISHRVHAFYYPWYGDPEFDNGYYHWNHKYLPSWRNNLNQIYPTGAHNPPLDIGSNFYPELGSYSSSDAIVIDDHMKQCKYAGIGVISISYYPPGMADDNGKDWQSLFPIILDTADHYNIKVAFHIEPYKGRNAESVKLDLQHIITTYSKHNAFYKFTKNNKELPLVYIYDSYQINPSEWKTILQSDGHTSIRNTWFDAHVIGLIVERSHLQDILLAGFDGFYSYFATDGFTFGSTRSNWDYMNKFANNHNLIFIPSVGPGYIDTRIRPWNGENTRNRLNGKYYKESWKKALEISPSIISITSFNEWHEGTQIEKAVPKQILNFKYLDYSPNTPEFYLLLTRKFIDKFGSDI